MARSPAIALIDRAAQRPAARAVRTDRQDRQTEVLTVPVPFADGALCRLDLQADGAAWLIFSAAVPTIFAGRPAETEIRDLDVTELRHGRDLAADLAGDPMAVATAVVDWLIDDVLSGQPLDRDPEPLLRAVRLALIDSAGRSAKIGAKAQIVVNAAHRALDGREVAAAWSAEGFRPGDRLSRLLDDAVARLAPRGWEVEFFRGRVYRHPAQLRAGAAEPSGHERLAAAAQAERTLRRIRGD